MTPQRHKRLDELVVDKEKMVHDRTAPLHDIEQEITDVAQFHELILDDKEFQQIVARSVKGDLTEVELDHISRFLDLAQTVDLENYVKLRLLALQHINDEWHGIKSKRLRRRYFEKAQRLCDRALRLVKSGSSQRGEMFVVKGGEVLKKMHLEMLDFAGACALVWKAKSKRMNTGLTISTYYQELYGDMDRGVAFASFDAVQNNKEAPLISNMLVERIHKKTLKSKEHLVSTAREVEQLCSTAGAKAHGIFGFVKSKQMHYVNVGTHAIFGFTQTEEFKILDEGDQDVMFGLLSQRVKQKKSSARIIPIINPALFYKSLEIDEIAYVAIVSPSVYQGLQMVLGRTWKHKLNKAFWENKHKPQQFLKWMHKQLGDWSLQLDRTMKPDLGVLLFPI